MKKNVLVICIIIAFALSPMAAFAIYDNSVTISSLIDTGTETYVDNGNEAALDPDATEGYDSGMDVPEPSPPNSDYLSVYFPHAAWGSLFGDNFMIDVRDSDDPLTNAVKVYQFEVDTDQNGQTVNLTFTIGPSYSGSYGVVVYDVDGTTYQNIREDNTYSFTAGVSVRNLELRLGDATAPSVSITYPLPGNTLISNTAYTITWTTSDISPVRDHKVYYSVDAGTNWTLIDSVSGTTLSIGWTTPDTYTTHARVKVVAEDWPGNIGSAESATSFNIGPNQMTNSFANGWHMTSVPLIPSNNSIASIYGDDVVGAYFVFDYSQTAGYGMVSTVNHGSGYWLALEDVAPPVDIDLDGIPAFTNTNVSLNLGWNIVGDALPITVPKTSLSFTDGVDTYSFTDAVNASWIASVIWGYSGSYFNATDLDPWGGYWVQALITELEMITSPPGAGGWDGVDLPGELDNENDWFVPIELTLDDLSDHLSGFGVAMDATNGYDLWFDTPTPPLPPSGQYVHLIFNHPEWMSPAGVEFNRDVRAPVTIGSTETWEGTIEASQPGEITIDFGDITQIIPDGYQATAEINNEIIDLIVTSQFTIQYQAPSQVLISVTGALSRVDDLTISLRGSDVVLDWSTVPGAETYNIYRSSHPYFDITGLVPIAASNNPQYIDSGAAAGESYFYRVTGE